MLLIILSIYYLFGALYYGAKYMEDAFKYRNVTAKNIFRVGLSGELYAVFWPILIIHYITAMLLTNENASTIVRSAIAYIVYPIKIIDYINEKINNNIEEDE